MEAHHAASATSLILPALNLAVLVGFLVWKLRAPLARFVRQRHLYVRDEVSRVSRQLEDSQQRYQEFSSKLRAIDAEVGALRDQAKSDAVAAQLAIRAGAKKIAQQILEDAKTGANNAFQETRSSLKAEFGARVIDRAEALIRGQMNDGLRTQVREGFVRQVGAQ